MKFHCLICNEDLTDKKKRIPHLRLHRLHLDDIKNQHVFGWNNKHLKIEYSGSKECPYCFKETGVIVNHYEMMDKKINLSRFLVRCNYCGKLFFFFTNSVPKDKKVSCLNCKYHSYIPDLFIHNCNWHEPSVLLGEELANCNEECLGYCEREKK